MTRTWAFFVVLWGTTTLSALDWEPRFGARATAEVGSQPRSLNAIVDVGFDAGWGLVHGQLLAGVSYREGRAQWDWSAAWLAMGDGTWSLKGGLWADDPGPAQFRSLVPSFTAGSGTEFFASAGTAPLPVPAKGTLTLVAGEWSLVAEVSPWRPETPVPDASSPWFPRKDVPTSIPGLIYPLGTLIITPSERTNETLPDWPLKAQVRWSALWGDASLGFFHGADPQVAFPVRLVLEPLSAGGDQFDIVLRPERPPVSQIWATLQMPIGGGTVWTEQRLTRERAKAAEGFLLETGPTFALLQKSTTSDVWEGVGGGAYSLSLDSWGTLRGWFEGSLYRDLGNPEQLPPDFTSGLVLGLSSELARGQVRFDLLGGTPWAWDNGWLWARATWNIVDGRSVWIGIPHFWGPPTTTWGQFSERRSWAIGTVWQN